MAAAGFHPARCLPVVVDVGTANRVLREDPLYMGLDQDRIEGDAYYDVRALSFRVLFLLRPVPVGSQCHKQQPSAMQAAPWVHGEHACCNSYK